MIVRIILWICLIVLIVYGLVKEIKKECSKLTPEECKSKKRKIIGSSISITGLLIILPGISWFPAGTATLRYGKTYGEKVLFWTILTGLLVLISGIITYVI